MAFSISTRIRYILLGFGSREKTKFSTFSHTEQLSCVPPHFLTLVTHSTNSSFSRREKINLSNKFAISRTFSLHTHGSTWTRRSARMKLVITTATFLWLNQQWNYFWTAGKERTLRKPCAVTAAYKLVEFSFRTRRKPSQFVEWGEIRNFFFLFHRSAALLAVVIWHSINILASTYHWAASSELERESIWGVTWIENSNIELHTDSLWWY